MALRGSSEIASGLIQEVGHGAVIGGVAETLGVCAHPGGSGCEATVVGLWSSGFPAAHCCRMPGPWELACYLLVLMSKGLTSVGWQR